VKVWIITNFSHFITSGPDFDFLQLCLSAPTPRYLSLFRFRLGWRVFGLSWAAGWFSFGWRVDLVRLSWASMWVVQLNYGLEVGFIEGQFGCRVG
jgi:hypothetical protein